jgi:predicted nucleotidyltransferase
MRLGNFEIAREDVEAFCKKWKIDELSVFGSALREDFRLDSDVDVLISLMPGETMTLESYMGMREELSGMFGGREIDLVQKRLLTNRFRRARILETREIVYAN